MKKIGKRAIALVVCVCLLVSTAVAAGLSRGDSLITLSYLEETYIPEVVEQGYLRAAEKIQETFLNVFGELDRLGESYLQQVGIGASKGHSESYARRTLAAYDFLELNTGAGIIVEKGRVCVDHNGTVVDVTNGKTLASGGVLTAGHRYLVAEDTQALFMVESDAARVAVEGDYQIEKSGEPATPFTDITVNDEYRDAVNVVYDRGLFAGTGDGSIFAPDQKLDRAMMMTVLFHLAGDPDEERFSAKTTFKDVPAGEWYGSYVNWAGEYKISAGYGDGSFKPLETLTQRHVVQFLFNFATSYLGLELEERADLSFSKEVHVLSDWGYEAMSWAVASGVVEIMKPNSTLSRSEVAVIMANFADYYL